MTDMELSIESAMRSIVAQLPTLAKSRTRMVQETPAAFFVRCKHIIPPIFLPVVTEHQLATIAGKFGAVVTSGILVVSKPTPEIVSE